MKISQKLASLDIMSHLVNVNVYEMIDIVIPQIQELESDSELLSDLLEMMTDINITKIRQKNGEWLVVIYEIEGSLSTGSTPKEAIQQAVAKWKEGRK
jgi:hypothetical protein